MTGRYTLFLCVIFFVPSGNMSEDPGMTMEEAEEAEENELLGGEEDVADTAVAHNIEETAEDLMTDMKLEDEIDELRLTEPGTLFA